MTLARPNAERRTGWRARYRDPDTGRTKWETLDASLTTAELRADWAARKSKALARRRLELEEGAPRATGTKVEAAVQRYYDDHPRLSTKTRELYQAATGKLIRWSAETRVRTTDELTAPRLVSFRAALVREPKTVRAPGGRRPTGEPRSPLTVNKELRAIGTVLTYVRRLGLLPRLTGDDLADALQKLKAPPKRIDYRKPAELRALLDAAMAHDADTFRETRAEHRGDSEPGATLRHRPIAPMVAVALLTGLRVEHLLALRWEDIDLDSEPGAIVPGSGSYTKRAGVIGLEISPALRALLVALRPAEATGTVFDVGRGEAIAAPRRLARYGAPPGSNWQALRRTCGCYLTNAPGIFGAASAYRSAKQLGHSVTVAERSYVDVVRGIPPEAKTLEAAMGIEAQMTALVDCFGK